MRGLTTWEYSVATEASRILQITHQTYVGFYKSHGFYVLPKNIKSKVQNIIILPKFEYHSIPKFWKRVAKINIYSRPAIIAEDLQKDFEDYLKNIDLDKPNFEKIKETWQRAEEDIIKTIYEILPTKRDSIKKITIYPTKSGSGCSFDWDNKGNFMLNLRDDQGIYQIVEGLISALTRDDVYQKLNGLWQESEIIADFLITQTKLANVLQRYETIENYIPTIKGTRLKDTGNLSKLSDDYYKKLNIPNFNNPFSLNGLTPEVNKKLIQNLTQNEKQIMYLLIKKSNNIVTFDQISDIIFVNEEKFSLFALAKFIQRLREKLEKNGISGSFIQTLRGRGYLLKN